MIRIAIFVFILLPTIAIGAVGPSFNLSNMGGTSTAVVTNNECWGETTGEVERVTTNAILAEIVLPDEQTITHAYFQCKTTDGGSDGTVNITIWEDTGIGSAGSCSLSYTEAVSSPNFPLSFGRSTAYRIVGVLYTPADNETLCAIDQYIRSITGSIPSNHTYYARVFTVDGSDIPDSVVGTSTGIPGDELDAATWTSANAGLYEFSPGLSLTSGTQYFIGFFLDTDGDLTGYPEVNTSNYPDMAYKDESKSDSIGGGRLSLNYANESDELPDSIYGQDVDDDVVIRIHTGSGSATPAIACVENIQIVDGSTITWNEADLPDTVLSAGTYWMSVHPSESITCLAKASTGDNYYQDCGCSEAPDNNPGAHLYNFKICNNDEEDLPPFGDDMIYYVSSSGEGDNESGTGAWVVLPTSQSTAMSMAQLNSGINCSMSESTWAIDPGDTVRSIDSTSTQLVIKCGGTSVENSVIYDGLDTGSDCNWTDNESCSGASVLNGGVRVASNTHYWKLTNFEIGDDTPRGIIFPDLSVASNPEIHGFEISNNKFNRHSWAATYLPYINDGLIYNNWFAAWPDGNQWSSSTTYSVGNIVWNTSNDGKTNVYKCKAGNTNKEPGDDPSWTTYWLLYNTGQNIMWMGGKRNIIADNVLTTGKTLIISRPSRDTTPTGNDAVIAENIIINNFGRRQREEGISLDTIGNSATQVGAFEWDIVDSVSGADVTLSDTDWGGGDDPNYVGYYLAGAETANGEAGGRIYEIIAQSDATFTLDRTPVGLAAGDVVILGTPFLSNYIANNDMTHIQGFGMSYNNIIENNNCTSSSLGVIYLKHLYEIAKSSVGGVSNVTGQCGRAPTGYNLIKNNVARNNISLWEREMNTCSTPVSGVYSVYGNTVLDNTTGMITARYQYYYHDGNTYDQLSSLSSTKSTTYAYDYPYIVGTPTIATNGTTVSITWSESVTTTNYANGDLYLTVGEDYRTKIDLESISGTGSSRTFTAASTITSGRDVGLWFMPASSNSIIDSDSWPMSVVGDKDMTNNSTQ